MVDSVDNIKVTGCYQYLELKIIQAVRVLECLPDVGKDILDTIEATYSRKFLNHSTWKSTIEHIIKHSINGSSTSISSNSYDAECGKYMLYIYIPIFRVRKVKGGMRGREGGAR